MSRLGAFLLLIGIGSFILPMMGRQFQIVTVFGENQETVGLIAVLAGIVLLFLGRQKSAPAPASAPGAHAPGAHAPGAPAPATVPPVLPEESPRSAAPAVSGAGSLPEAFQRVEDEFYRLRGMFDTGHLTEDQFKTALRNLVLTYQGRARMIGTESGRWYVHNGKEWIESVPPSAAASPAAAAGKPAWGPPSGAPPAPAATGSRFAQPPWWVRIVILAVGLVILNRCIS